MSLKINNRGLRILNVDRAHDAELIAIQLMMLVLLYGLSTMLIDARMYLCAYSYISAAIPFVLSLSINMTEVVLSFFEG